MYANDRARSMWYSVQKTNNVFHGLSSLWWRASPPTDLNFCLTVFCWCLESDRFIIRRFAKRCTAGLGQQGSLRNAKVVHYDKNKKMPVWKENISHCMQSVNMIMRCWQLRPKASRMKISIQSFENPLDLLIEKFQPLLSSTTPNFRPFFPVYQNRYLFTIGHVKNTPSHSAPFATIFESITAIALARNLDVLSIGSSSSGNFVDKSKQTIAVFVCWYSSFLLS